MAFPRPLMMKCARMLLALTMTAYPAWAQAEEGLQVSVAASLKTDGASKSGASEDTDQPSLPPIPKSSLHRDPIHQQENCVAAGIYHEARGEGAAGMEAVGNVVMNRSTRWHLKPCDVIYQKHSGVCQFTWVCNAFSLVVSDIYSWHIAQSLAKHLVRQERPDRTRGSMFFHTCSAAELQANANPKPIVINHLCFYR